MRTWASAQHAVLMARQERIDPVALLSLALIITPVPTVIAHATTCASVVLLVWIAPITIGVIGFRFVCPRLAPIDPCTPGADVVTLVLVTAVPRLMFSHAVDVTICVMVWLVLASVGRLRIRRIPTAIVVRAAVPQRWAQRTSR